LSEARAGRHEAFERLVEEQASRLYTIACRITHDAQLAEDVVQEAFLRVLDGRAALRKVEAADSWLARVVSSLAIDQLRLRASRQRREELHDMQKDHGSRAPHEDLLNAEQAEQVSAALASLSPETRAAVWLNAVEGVPVREVALSLGENRGKTHRRIQDGME